MSYGLKYTIPFAALDDTPCTVQIEQEDYSGEATELQAAAEPFTVEIDDEDFIYTPLRLSTARLRVVGSDYLQTLYTTGYRQHRVTLLRGGQVAWCGFIKPEVYTQDYVDDLFELEVECVSALSVLEYIDYAMQSARPQFVSFKQLLARCMEAARGRYAGILVPRVYALSKEGYEAGEDILQKLTVSEQNFFDEDGKPWKLLDVLEELCKFLAWTCCDWDGTPCLFDADHTGTYDLCDAALQPSGTATPQTISVQSAGFMGANHSLDILGGYNKVTVKCSNYPMGDVGSASLDWGGMDVLAYPEEAVSSGGNTVSKRLIMNPSAMTGNLRTIAYDVEPVSPGEADFHAVEITDYEPWRSGPLDADSNNADGILGAMPVKLCRYGMEQEDGAWKPDIDTYNYDDIINVNDNAYLREASGDLPLLRVTFPNMVYPPGAVCINGEISSGGGDYLYLQPDIRGYQMLRYSLRIGGQWYNGAEGVLTPWSETPALNELKVEDYSNGWYTIKNEKTLQMPYDDASGHIIDTGRVKAGELEFTLYPDSEHIGGFGLRGFTVSFVAENGQELDGGGDRVYENVVNEEYVNELDDIELKISSYNNDGACYGKVVADGQYLTDNLYNAILGKTKRPEDMLITRIVNHYSATRVKLTQELKADTRLTPLTRLTDAFQSGKTFVITGGSIDYRMNRFTCKMIEI